MNVTIQLDAASVRQFARNLDLAAKEIERGMAKAINRTAFEILEAERTAARAAFPTASDRGREFLSGRESFRFEHASPGKLEAPIYPNPLGASGKRRSRNSPATRSYCPPWRNSCRDCAQS